MLKSLIFIASLHLINSQATQCNETEFLLGTIKFNVNHLKDHRPPVQNYNDPASLYGKQDNENYVFFNLMDYVREAKIDGHSIAANCQPRQAATKVSTNSPSACIPEPDPTNNCLDKKSCWTAIGACNNVTAVLIDSTDSSKGVRLVYGGGDDPTKKFVVTLNCCTSGNCIKPKGLDTPALYKTSDCPEGAQYCVEMNTPFGCDCSKRASLDAELGKKEFHCDATPSGLHGGLSTGSWLVIFFFVIVGLYIVIGVAYNYSEGKRGEELMPHLDMWKDLGGLIYDGFMYLKTCGDYREGVQYDTIG